jgi:molecular chaperone DnaK
MDVTPLSLGIETEGGVMTALIERNATIPTTKSETFSTAADNQPAVTVSVYQGERPMAHDNRLLDQFNLDGLPPSPRGVPQIEVTFDIDVNGILNVSAKDKATGKEHSVKIQNSSGLSEEEIERMRQEAEANATEDKARRELAEQKNIASGLAHQTEKTIAESGDKLDEASKAAIEASVAKVKEAADGDNIEAIKTAITELEQAAQAFAAMYEQAAAEEGGAPEAAPDPTATASADADDVIDAEFEKK